MSRGGARPAHAATAHLGANKAAYTRDSLKLCNLRQPGSDYGLGFATTSRIGGEWRSSQEGACCPPPGRLRVQGSVQGSGFVYPYLYTYTYINIHTYTNMYIYMYVYIYICICIYTCMRSGFRVQGSAGDHQADGRRVEETPGQRVLQLPICKVV